MSFISDMCENVFNACSGHNFLFLLMQFSENNNLFSNEINFFYYSLFIAFRVVSGF